MRLLKLNKQNGISFGNYFHISLNFETLKQNESCKMFTSFQNALLSLLVRNRLLNKCKKHLRVLPNSTM